MLGVIFALGNWPWKLFSYNTASVRIEHWEKAILLYQLIGLCCTLPQIYFKLIVGH